MNVIPAPWESPAPVGIVPDPMVADERYTIEFDGDDVRVIAATGAGEARASTGRSRSRSIGTQKGRPG